MYERFSKTVERVVNHRANRIARQLDAEYIGTEHILLAIIEEEVETGDGILKSLGISHRRLEEEIQRLIRDRMEDTWVLGRLPGTPHFRNVIARAIEEARALNMREVNLGHLLLGLLVETGSVAYRALTAMGLTPEQVRRQMRQACSSEGTGGRQGGE